MVRLNSTASNMANASTVGSSPDTAFKAKRPIFEALLREEQLTQGAKYLGGVKVAGMVDDQAINRKILDRVIQKQTRTVSFTRPMSMR